MSRADPMEIHVRNAASADAASIAEIYNHYVLNTVVTFEEALVSSTEMERRMGDVSDASLPWLIAEQASAVVGYAYATRWRTRGAYRFSVESTAYVSPQHRRAGIGSTLYLALFAELERNGLHTALAAIALPNQASVALHERLGFRKVAHLEQVGFKLGRWIDVGYWQKLLDR